MASHDKKPSNNIAKLVQTPAALNGEKIGHVVEGARKANTVSSLPVPHLTANPFDGVRPQPPSMMVAPTTLNPPPVSPAVQPASPSPNQGNPQAPEGKS